MAPITVASHDDDPNLSVDSEDKVGKHRVDPFSFPGALVTEGRDDDHHDDGAGNNAANNTKALDDYQPDEQEIGRRQSNLFIDENEINTSSSNSVMMMEQFSNNKGYSYAPPPSIKGMTLSPISPTQSEGLLSLMPSSSSLEHQAANNASPTDSLSSLDNVDLGGNVEGVPPLSLFATEADSSFANGMEVPDSSSTFATGILSQIDADEELARQLQEEEKKFKWKTPKKAKPRVVKSFADSWFGEPLPSELKASYSRVQKAPHASNYNTNAGVGTTVPTDSLSEGLSMLTKSFKMWGKDLTTAATDFFGEDVGMQVKRSHSTRSKKSGNTSSENADNGPYRNAV
mmetsp:Transcript_36773/g.77159  ORF Transcript_36773/g.77159 Transcript_36773/m.77159 type:complete len:344 (+) Transcript_36773:99-1130(+)